MPETLRGRSPDPFKICAGGGSNTRDRDYAYVTCRRGPCSGFKFRTISAGDTHTHVKVRSSAPVTSEIGTQSAALGMYIVGPALVAVSYVNEVWYEGKQAVKSKQAPVRQRNAPSLPLTAFLAMASKSLYKVFLLMQVAMGEPPSKIAISAPWDRCFEPFQERT